LLRGVGGETKKKGQQVFHAERSFETGQHWAIMPNGCAREKCGKLDRWVGGSFEKILKKRRGREKGPAERCGGGKEALAAVKK